MFTLCKSYRLKQPFEPTWNCLPFSSPMPRFSNRLTIPRRWRWRKWYLMNLTKSCRLLWWEERQHALNLSLWRHKWNWRSIGCCHSFALRNFWCAWGSLLVSIWPLLWLLISTTGFCNCTWGSRSLCYIWLLTLPHPVSPRPTLGKLVQVLVPPVPSPSQP